MLIPAGTWSQAKLQSFNRDLAEMSDRIKQGEKMTAKKVRDIVKRNSGADQ